VELIYLLKESKATLPALHTQYIPIKLSEALPLQSASQS